MNKELVISLDRYSTAWITSRTVNPSCKRYVPLFFKLLHPCGSYLKIAYWPRSFFALLLGRYDPILVSLAISVIWPGFWRWFSPDTSSNNSGLRCVAWSNYWTSIEAYNNVQIHSPRIHFSNLLRDRICSTPCLVERVIIIVYYNINVQESVYYTSLWLIWT